MAKKTNGNGVHPEGEIPENEQPREEYDIAAELAALGKTIGEAVNKAWNSEERHKIEQEVRDGMKRFAGEVETAAKKVRDTDVGHKVNEGVKQVREDIQSGKVAEDLRRGTVEALRALRDALDKMADSFTETQQSGEPKE